MPWAASYSSAKSLRFKRTHHSTFRERKALTTSISTCTELLFCLQDIWTRWHKKGNIIVASYLLTPSPPVLKLMWGKCLNVFYSKLVRKQSLKSFCQSMVGRLSSMQSQKMLMKTSFQKPSPCHLVPFSPSSSRLLKSDRSRRQSPSRKPFALPG